jgi:hypothetical protein
VPAILNYLFNYPDLSFQQDGGLGHKAEATLALLKSWNVIMKTGLIPRIELL